MIKSGTVVAGPHTRIEFERTSADTNGALLSFKETFQVGPQRPPAHLHATQTERDQNLRVYVPYTTGFGVGVTLVDELWLGVEFKTHRYEVNAPGGPVTSYQTYSIGPVLGYKAFIYKGLFADAYLRYWPNVASSLDGNKVALQGTDGTVEHSAHDFGVFANVSIGYAFDL